MKYLGIFVIGFVSSSIAMASSLNLNELREKYTSRYFEEVTLSSGKTHFQSIGSGPVIILVHGVSGPLAVWDKNVDILARSGFRVVRYDLFGRGFSERLSHSSYSLDTYQKQLDELIIALRIDSRVRLVGSSFGGIVVTEYALRHPDRVEGLVLIGPAGFPIVVPWTAKLKDIPLLGNIFTALFAYSTILKQNDHYFVSGEMPNDLRPFVADQLSVPGTTNAILKTMQNSPVQAYTSSYKKLGKLKVPVGVIWGRKDATFPYENSDVLIGSVPQSKLMTIEDSGHLPQYEKADQVNPILLQFQQIFHQSDSTP